MEPKAPIILKCPSTQGQFHAFLALFANADLADYADRIKPVPGMSCGVFLAVTEAEMKDIQGKLAKQGGHPSQRITLDPCGAMAAFT